MLSTPVATLADMQPAQAPGPGVRRELDHESRQWLADLHAEGVVRDAAVERLYDLLHRAARFEVSRRAGSLASLRPGEIDQIVHDSAADALVSVLARLDDFEGRSRFTTWAYKFAILETAVKIRRRAWQGREIPRPPDGWEAVPDARETPAAEAEQRELLGVVHDAVATVLTPRQREVLVAVAIDGVPIDVLSERLGTTRGALYKTLHDARRKLRATLAASGFEIAGERGGGGR